MSAHALPCTYTPQRVKFGEIPFRPVERAEASGPEGDGEGLSSSSYKPPCAASEEVGQDSRPWYRTYRPVGAKKWLERIAERLLASQRGAVGKPKRGGERLARSRVGWCGLPVIVG